MLLLVDFVTSEWRVNWQVPRSSTTEAVCRCSRHRYHCVHRLSTWYLPATNQPRYSCMHIRVYIGLNLSKYWHGVIRLYGATHETTQTYAADSTILMTMTYRPINNVCIYLLHNALYCLHNVQRIMRLLVSYTSWFSLMHLYALRYCGVKASYWVILLGGEGALERICP